MTTVHQRAMLTAMLLALGACDGGSGRASYTIGGTLAGLASGSQVQLLNNGGDALTLTSDGAFTFAVPMSQGGGYAVTVGTQPGGQTCVVNNGAGSGISARVTSVQVMCAADAPPAAQVQGVATPSSIVVVTPKTLLTSK